MPFWTCLGQFSSSSKSSCRGLKSVAESTGGGTQYLLLVVDGVSKCNQSPGILPISPLALASLTYLPSHYEAGARNEHVMP